MGAVVFNRDIVPYHDVEVTWQMLGFQPGSAAHVRDLILHKDIANVTAGGLDSDCVLFTLFGL